MTDSDFYSRYPEALTDRMDSNYNDPKYGVIGVLLGKSRYPVILLGQPEILKGITSGKTPKGLHYTSEGVPFIGSTQVSDGLVDIDNAPKIPREVHETTLVSSQIKKGNVLITIAGTIGRCAVYAYDRDCNANQAIAILNVNAAKVEPDFLACFLNSELGQLFFGKLQHISSQPNINMEEIKQISIILPNTVEEQKDIISKTQAIEKEAAKLEAESESLVEKATATIAVELDINVPNGTKPSYFFKSAEENTSSFYVLPSEISDRMQFFFFHPRYAILELLQEKYRTIRLEAACSIPIHRGEQPEYDEAGAITVIKTVNVKNSYIDYESCLKVSQDFLERFPSAQVKKNDVLVSSTGLISMGKVAVHTKDEPTVVDGHISIIRLKNEFNPYFVAYFLQSHLGQMQFEKWFSGSSGQIEIQPQDLNQFIMPSSEENGVPTAKQIEIAFKITQKLDNARKLKKDAKCKLEESKMLFKNLLYNAT